MLKRTRDRITKFRRHRGLVDDPADEDENDENGEASEHAGLTRLAASAASGEAPPAGPEWRRGALPPLPLTHREAPCVEDVAAVPRLRPYRPWAELLKRTFGVDVLACPRCDGRLRLLAMVTAPKSVARYLRAIGEPADAPTRGPARGPTYWKSRVLRRAAGDEAAA